MKTWHEKLEEKMGLTKEQEDTLAQEAISIVQKKIQDELFDEATPIVVHDHIESGRYKEIGLDSKDILPFIQAKVAELTLERMDELQQRMITEASAIYQEKANEILTKFLCQKLWNQQLVQFNMMAAEYRNCKDCGEEFGMTMKEIEFFKNKNLTIPVRCPKCRQTRKNIKVGTIGNDQLKKDLVEVANPMAEALRKAGKVK